MSYRLLNTKNDYEFNLHRRHFLRSTSIFFGSVLAGSIISTPLQVLAAESITQWPIGVLKQQLTVDQAILILPDSPEFEAYQFSYNMRTVLIPKLRVVCQTMEAVAKTFAWVKQNKIPFAIRGGGHSYEGFSQSKGVVIDMRLLKNVSIDPLTKTMETEAGVQLGQIYAALSEHQLALPAGSCPTVGIVGHTTGGGYGLLGRKLGLACDSLISCDIICADGVTRTASANENADLFWAIRGAGNGQLGIITKMKFKVYTIDKVQVFSMGWLLPKNKAARVIKAWQMWAPKTDANITSIFKISKHTSGLISLRCVGQSTGSNTNLIKELSYLQKIETPTSELKYSEKTFMEAVAHFSGGFDYEAVNMKAKSDYVNQVMSDVGITTLLTELENLPPGYVAAIFDSYGGYMDTVPANAMAFSHRLGTLFSIQYYSQWSKSTDNEKRLGMISQLYQAMRPFVSGFSYVNYCDKDLKNYGYAYWGDNYSTLKQIKIKFDPENIFQHPQGI